MCGFVCVCQLLNGELVEVLAGARLGCTAKKSPATKFSIRNMDNTGSYRVVVGHGTGGSRTLETMEYTMAMLKLYEGAVYMHEGQTYVVAQFDQGHKEARVQRNDVSYYTEPRDHTKVLLLGRSAARELNAPFQHSASHAAGTAAMASTDSAASAGVVPVEGAAGTGGAAKEAGSAKLAPDECVVVVHGRVRVTKTLYGYRKKRSADSQLIDMVCSAHPHHTITHHTIPYTIHHTPCVFL
jgi:ATP-dependent helicase YprA (DUF1998 family)